jgi:hypothetical protein
VTQTDLVIWLADDGEHHSVEVRLAAEWHLKRVVAATAKA